MNMKNNRVTYSTVGDYQLPNLTLRQPQKPLGKYGRLRRTYLMQHRPVLYNSMLLNGTLHPHLLEVEQTAESQKQQMMDELLKANVYDGFYDKVKEKTKEMLKAKRKHDRMDIKYAGSYVLDGRTVYIVKYDNAEIHVVDGCWQILRVRYAEGRNMMYYEFREIKRNVFLPVSGYAEMHLDKEKLPKGSVVMSVAYDYK